MVRKGASSPLGDGKLAALRLLKQAHDDAEEAGQDPKQFAVSRNELASHGASESDLRWLLAHRYADQFEEIPRRGHEQRQFRVVTGLALTDNGCFVLTHGGRIFSEANRLDGPARTQAPAAPAVLAPRERICWVRRRHELLVDGKVAKRFLHKAEVQWSALDKFEAEGWRGSVEIELSGNGERNASQRARELVKDLNTNLDTSLIHFRKDLDGNRIAFDLP